MEGYTVLIDRGAVSIKTPLAFFTELEQIILKLIYNKDPNSQSNLEREE